MNVKEREMFNLEQSFGFFFHIHALLRLSFILFHFNFSNEIVYHRKLKEGAKGAKGGISKETAKERKQKGKTTGIAIF